MNAPCIPQVFCSRASRIGAGVIILLGSLTLFGWISGVSTLASFRSSYIPMAPSSALCFLCIGLGLMSTEGAWRWISRLLAATVFLVACAKIIEIVCGLRFGIDEWLVRNPNAFGEVQTGRMSPITAVSFGLVATGVFFLADVRQRNKAGPPAAATALISAVVLMGYLDGTPLLYGDDFIPVALTTALAFLVSAVALLAAAGPQAWPMRAFLDGSTRALLMRHFLPVIVAVTLFSGWAHATLHGHVVMNPAVSSTVSAIFLATVIVWIISKVSAAVGDRIDRAEKARNQAQAELVSMNACLEQMIRDRTRELEEKNALMQEELEMARELQLALLPQKFPSIPSNVPATDSAVRFLSYYFPTSNVSGDFFSVFPVREKAVGIFICDVMGHGVQAALVTSMIRALVEEHVHEALEPGMLVTRINRGLVAILEQARTTMYATGFYLIVDIKRGELSYATAGHPRPLVISHCGSQAEPLDVTGIAGPALGIFPTAVYGTGRRPIARGDLIMMFTDGLFEVENAEGAMFSEQDLLATVRHKMTLPSREFFDEVLGEVRRFSSRAAFDDDVCLVGVEVHSLDGEAS